MTKGKVRDYDRLPKKQRKVVIRELVKIHTLKNIKSRPSSATIATVNGVSILKRDADSFLKKVTKGKVKDFDKLDKRQRKMVITDLAKPIILKNIVEHNVTQAEKEGVLKQVWLEKQKSTIQVSNEEVVALYEAKKRQALQQNANADVPKYLTVARNLRSEIVEKRITQNLMKDAKIEINFDLNASR